MLFTKKQEKKLKSAFPCKECFSHIVEAKKKNIPLYVYTSVLHTGGHHLTTDSNIFNDKKFVVTNTAFNRSSLN